MKLKTLPNPEVHVVDGLPMTCTHQREVLTVDSLHGAKLRITNGCFRSDGSYVVGVVVSDDSISKDELSDLTDSKPDYRLSEIKAKIETVKAARLSEEKRIADAKAEAGKE